MTTKEKKELKEIAVIVVIIVITVFLISFAFVAGITLAGNLFMV